MLNPDSDLFGICKHLRDFKNVRGIGCNKIICMGKLFKVSWMGLHVEWGEVSGNHQARANSVTRLMKT